MDLSKTIENKQFDSSSLLWYKEPAKEWENALPVGNGRLGAMVFGGIDEEQLSLNEDTYYSGGPYSSVVPEGHKVLPEIQKSLFEGKPIKAHKLFGRHMMGYPIEQQKYQSIADLHLFFEKGRKSSHYRRWLDLSTGMIGSSYQIDGVTYTREIFASHDHQTIAVKLNVSEPGMLSLDIELRGVRNNSHSNYATDYFRMDGSGNNELILTGKSADYLGIEGKLRYEARARVCNEGGEIVRDDSRLKVSNANSLTIYFVAATNFVNYRDVSGDESKRVGDYLTKIEKSSYEDIRSTALSDHSQLFNRVSLGLEETPNSCLATNERREKFQSESDPQLAALVYQFGRYLLITSSRSGTQASNLQGIWNNNQNPAWDAKYTTNINLQMNYWAVESANLSELSEPLFKLIEEVSDQGAEVAKEHYGASGWVLHQNTDIWRVAAPMDGPTWGTFTVGGAWLVTHMWEHYLYTQDESYLKKVYPTIKGCVEFFMDFLIEHPNGKWLVTSPSNSPENPPKAPGYEYFYDEVTGNYYFTTITFGASMDMQILNDLFKCYEQTANILKLDNEFSNKVAAARKRLVPAQIGKDGSLQEWCMDYEQMEDKHRHFSHMYGLYPGNVLSAKRTPEFVEPIKAVLEQRGDGGTGFSHAWKMALWARLSDGDRAHIVFKSYMKIQCFDSLFSACYKPLQVDGALGLTAAVTEMLMQSHEGIIELLPALPSEWASGKFNGVCSRSGFELNFTWSNMKITQVEILSKVGKKCRINTGNILKLTRDGSTCDYSKNEDGSIEFSTEKGCSYKLS